MDFLERSYEAWGAKLHHYLLGMLRSPADAEDALQTVFVKLAQRGEAGIADLGAYLFSAARNEALSLRRRQGRTAPPAPPELFEPAGGDDEERRQLGRALAELPDEQREVLLLKVWEGLSFREIAALTGVPQDTAASRYRYALDKLKELVK